MLVIKNGQSSEGENWSIFTLFHCSPLRGSSNNAMISSTRYLMPYADNIFTSCSFEKRSTRVSTIDLHLGRERALPLSLGGENDYSNTASVCT